jgi:Arc/MetJ family transcription regulator
LQLSPEQARVHELAGGTIRNLRGPLRTQTHAGSLVADVRIRLTGPALLRGSKAAPCGPAVGYHLRMSKTSVEVDQDIAREAADILGTSTLRATIDAALREVVYSRRRLELIALLSQDGRFDFDAAEHAWGSDD